MGVNKWKYYLQLVMRMYQERLLKAIKTNMVKKWILKMFSILMLLLGKFTKIKHMIE